MIRKNSAAERQSSGRRKRERTKVFMEKLRILFGGIDLNWKRVVISAVAAGTYTALVSIIPQLEDTSLHTIAVTMEVWILFGILIIVNAKSNPDSALKCFVFFLISQPLVYLLQVPFKPEGWGLFGYYGYWFRWTVLCLPMGYIGYYIKKDNWWGYLILLPMIALTAGSYYRYFSYFTFCYPCYLLISLFCAGAMLLYPNALFDNRKIRRVGTVISALLIAVITVIVAVNPFRYSTDILYSVDGENITGEVRAALEDGKYGNVSVEYVEGLETYTVHADFRKKGMTELILTMPEGETKRYDLRIGLNTYDIEEK